MKKGPVFYALISVIMLASSLNKTGFAQLGVTNGGGTFTPQSLFHIHDNHNSGQIFQLTNLTSGNDALSKGFVIQLGENMQVNFKNLYDHTNAGMSFFTRFGLFARERLTILNNGNVGIGITAPAQRLSIAGNLGLMESDTTPAFFTILESGNLSSDLTLTLPNSTGNAGQILTSNGTGGLIWTNSESQLTFAGGLTRVLNMVKLGGNLMDNTALIQNGNDTLKFQNNGSGNIIFNLANSGDLDFQDNGNSVFHISDLGKIGIGTTTPYYKLHITGTDGNYQARILDVTNNASSATQVYAIVGEINSNSGSSPAAGIFGSSANIYGSGIGVKGESIGESGTGIYAVASNTAGTNYAIKAYNANNLGFSGFFQGGKNYFEGNVGIGTTSPLQKLSVEGTIGILETGALPTYHTIIKSADLTNNITLTLPPDAGNDNDVLTSNGSGVLSWEPRESPLTFTNGLTKSSDVVILGGALDRSTTISLNDAHTLSFNSSGSGDISFNLNGTGDFVVNDWWATKFIVKNSGFVGIGTSLPQSLTHISGTESSNGGKILYVENESTTYNGNICGIKGEINSRGSTTACSGIFGYSAADYGNGVGIRGESEGHLGIGVLARVNHSSGTTYALKAVNMSTNGFAGYFTGGKNYFEGNTGIGTDAPTAKLHAISTGGQQTAYFQGQSTGISGATMASENTSAAGGIAAHFKSSGSDATMIVTQTTSATGPLFKGFGSNGGDEEIRINNDGRVQLFNGNHIKTIEINPCENNTTDAGSIIMYSSTGSAILEMDANYGTTGKSRIITSVLEITGGADIAEPFTVLDCENILPGMVMVLDPANPGKLKPSEKPYDPCVAGIISGANDIAPGLILRQKQTETDGTHMVALSGRVYCLADASAGSIKPGDMLTSSSVRGYAMKAGNLKKARGSIIGKAMSSLDRGFGHVLVLVTLQ